jgi:hypothetical protein
MHTTLKQIIDRAKAAKVGAGDNGVHQHLTQIENLAMEAQGRAGKYLAVLLRELLQRARVDPGARDELQEALARVPFAVDCSGVEFSRLSLDGSFEVGCGNGDERRIFTLVLCPGEQRHLPLQWTLPFSEGELEGKG